MKPQALIIITYLSMLSAGCCSQQNSIWHAINHVKSVKNISKLEIKQNTVSGIYKNLLIQIPPYMQSTDFLDTSDFDWWVISLNSHGLEYYAIYYDGLPAIELATDFIFIGVSRDKVRILSTVQVAETEFGWETPGDDGFFWDYTINNPFALERIRPHIEPFHIHLADRFSLWEDDFGDLDANGGPGPSAIIFGNKQMTKTIYGVSAWDGIFEHDEDSKLPKYSRMDRDITVFLRYVCENILYTSMQRIESE